MKKLLSIALVLSGGLLLLAAVTVRPDEPHMPPLTYVSLWVGVAGSVILAHWLARSSNKSS